MDKDQKPKSCEEETEEELLTERRADRENRVGDTCGREVCDPLSDDYRAGGGALYPAPAEQDYQI